MEGYTIKSISNNGVYFLVKDWRKNKALWVTFNKLKPEYLYKSAKTSMKALEKLLNVIDDYAEDTFSVVYIKDNSMRECGKLYVENISKDEWKNDYKVSMKEVSQEKNLKDIYEAYSSTVDITFIMQDTIEETTGKCISTEVIGFYYGVPDSKCTEKYKGKLKAEF